MSKHKKKKKNFEQIQKLQQIQARNEFFRRMRSLLAMMHCEDILDRMSDKHRDLFFNTRCQSLQVVGAKENTFHTDDLKWIKKAIVHELKKKTIDLNIAAFPGLEIDAYSFSTIGSTLKVFSKVLVDHYLTGKPEQAQMFLDFYDEPSHLRQWIDHLFDTTEYICSLISDLRTRLYFTQNNSTLNEIKHRVGMIITIQSVVPEKIHITIRNEKRTALRVGHVRASTVHWLSINPENMGMRRLGKDHFIDVYILEHALNRLVERNDCVYVQYLWMALVISVLECHYHKDQLSDRYMIDFKVYDQKTGYLVADFSESKLIIRTFLLITNDGTPEGSKLQANTGLSKADKEYLKLDKLSTFLSPEVYSSEKIRKIFREAGCHSLFNLKSEFDSRNLMMRKPASASLIEDYLQLNAPTEQEWDCIKGSGI